jgi:hypothetical protein
LYKLKSVGVQVNLAEAADGGALPDDWANLATSRLSQLAGVS